MAIVGPAVPYSTFLKKMKKLKMDIPGNSITVKALDTIIKNKLPKDPTCVDCRNQTLARLTYIGTFRDEGLLHGRYTGMDGNVVRTYDVIYNESWVRSYAAKAYNAAIRGKKLNDSTPVTHMTHKVTNSAHLDVAIKTLAKIK